METSSSLRFFARCSSITLFFFFFVSIFVSDAAAADELSIDVAHPTALRLLSGLPVDTSPGSKPGIQLRCERIHICGLPRLHYLSKYAHSIKVKVHIIEESPKALRIRNSVDACFHGNSSLGLCMCSQDKWERLTKGSWVRTISPYENRVLDIRMPGPSMEMLEVSIDEETSSFRIISLVLGFILLTVAPVLSESIVFYYSSAMAVGVILVILMVLFQGMKLLPTGRRSSLAIFMYSSLIGLGSFLLSYVPKLLQTALKDIGIDEDMYNSLILFLVVCTVLVGAWLGFWVVRKLVLAEDGSIDSGVATFVLWSIRIFAAIMILESSQDNLLAAGALISTILFSIARRFSRLRYIRRLRRRLLKMARGKQKITQEPFPGDSYDEYQWRLKTPEDHKSIKQRQEWSSLAACNSPIIGLAKTPPPSSQSDSDAYYSTFHDTPERREFSKKKWEKFTKESTKNALEGLVSSPEFTKWAVRNAERITLSPTTSDNDTCRQQRRWFYWF
ncbi:hypothetical protein Sjap_010190 [Stephania japonica]|uniref:Nuclear envelope integral membrane protein 1 n=1 Tax=Stephania japonica TaxID=461633 RepID=A0AAP0J949_9MAGN